MSDLPCPCGLRMCDNCDCGLIAPTALAYDPGTQPVTAVRISDAMKARMGMEDMRAIEAQITEAMRTGRGTVRVYYDYATCETVIERVDLDP